MQGTPMDPKFGRLMKFAENFKTRTKTSSLSNLYIIQAIDRDGNVVDEKYGMNLMTNYGMSQYFVSRQGFPTNLYIGNGSGSFNHTTNVLQSPIITTAAQKTSTTKSYAYPLYYDNITGVITCVVKYMEVYFDYTVDGIIGPVDVTEYGIGTAYNALWTHSWVYNSLGQKSAIRKEPGVRLEITVFMCMSYNVALIDDAAAEGKYICITNPYRFFNQSVVTMNDNSLYTFRRNDYYERTKTHTTGYQNNIETITSNMGAFTLLPPDVSDTTANSYIDGFISWTPGFNMMERVTMTNPIAFDTIGKPPGNKFFKQNGFSYSFGNPTLGIPFTQANITASYTCSYKTGQYTCADHYVNDARKWYTETSFNIDFATKLRFTNNNEIIEISLFRNMHPDDPIVAIDSAITTLYATDEYWNTSSWERIIDITSIPASLQTKRYWLTTDNVAINPVRGLPSFEFLASDGTTHAPTFGFRIADFDYGYVWSTADPSSSKKWFAIGQKIYVVSRGDVVVTSTGGTVVGYNNLVVNFAHNTSNAYFYETNITDAVPVPTQTASAGSTQIGRCRFSESENGYVIMTACSSSSNINAKTVKLDLTGSAVVQTQLDDAVDACAIVKSPNYVYIDKANVRRVYIKKLSDDTVVKQIDIRSDYAAPTFVFGWRNYVYITDTSNYIYMYDTTTDVLTELDSTFPGSNYSSYNSRLYAQMACSDNCLVLYLTNMDNYSNAWYVLYDNPTQVVSMASISDPVTNRSGARINVIDINTDSILMIRQSDIPRTNYRCAVSGMDLGKYIKTGTTDGVAWNENYTYPLVVWGEFGVMQGSSFALANMLPHRLVGTTSCVSTCNGQKNVSGKHWDLEVTNLGGYSGLPPGTQQ